MRLLKRVAAMFSSGSAPSDSSVSGTLWSAMTVTTPTSVSELAIVSGMRMTAWLIWKMSVFARAMSWPVWASSWNAKWSRWRWAKSRWRRSVSER